MKEYASAKHKSASITNLLAISQTNLLNFITNPNQIVCFNYDEEHETLKMIKGVETKAKAFDSARFSNETGKFVTVFEDKTCKIYNCDFLEKEYEVDLDS